MAQMDAKESPAGAGVPNSSSEGFGGALLIVVFDARELD